MKFVHLTSQPKISRIKRNGIRMGNGRRGRGVYAVPLMMMQCSSIDENTDLFIDNTERSSITLWQWLSNLTYGHRNLAAIIFNTNNDHWPANLFILIGATVGTDWANELLSNSIVITEDNLEFVRNSNKRGFLADLEVVVHNPKSLGLLLHAAQKAGFKTWDKFDDSIEIVFPAPVRSNMIERIIPLYRTNKQFKQRRLQSNRSN